MTDPWKNMPIAPRDRAILLFLPAVHHTPDPNRPGHPLDVAHGRCVGWWDEELQHWVTGFHPNHGHLHKVYPSLWTDLTPEPCRT